MITAALDPGPEVRQTIESVLSQDHPNIEYIFVDGASRPECFAHVEPYIRHMDVLIREPDEGISDAWNKALARASGDIVGIINADDYLMPGALSAVADACSRHPVMPIVHGDVVRISGGRETIQRSTMPVGLMFRFGTPVYHPATFVPRAVYARIGRFGKSYRIAMDYDFLLRAHQAGVLFERIPKPLAGFRAGGVSDRSPLAGFREVRDSQIENGFSRPLVHGIYWAKFVARKYVRPVLGL